MCGEMKVPPLLLPGSRVALVAPAGPLRDETDLQHARRCDALMGWEPVVGDHVLERNGYLAGSDEHRLADLNRFATDRSIDGIWCIRGGYGAMRLLDQLDYPAWFRRPKALIGYSDITATSLRTQRARGSRVVSRSDRARPSHRRSVARRSARPSSTDPNRAAPRRTRVTLCGGRARGRLIGGNLALLAALCGTRYAPSFAGAILVIEDVNESVYRIDRMLTQLRLSGALHLVAGIAFGQFTEIPEDPPKRSDRIDDRRAHRVRAAHDRSVPR